MITRRIVAVASLLLGILVLVFTAPAVATTPGDNDTLTRAEEDRIGTDPDTWDTDQDGLPDHWEVANETPSGVPLPDADPLHRNVYYRLVAADGNGSVTDRRIDRLQSWFESLPVRNPDGERGIRFHVVETKTAENTTTIGSGDEFIQAWRTHRNATGPVSLVYGELRYSVLSEADFDGQAVTGLGFAVSIRSRGVTIHELLHNLVGTYPPYIEGHCSGDPAHYCGGPTLGEDHQRVVAEVLERGDGTILPGQIHNPDISTPTREYGPGENITVSLAEAYLIGDEFQRFTYENATRVRVISNETYRRPPVVDTGNRTVTIQIDDPGSYEIFIEWGPRQAFTSVRVVPERDPVVVLAGPDRRYQPEEVLRAIALYNTGRTVPGTGQGLSAEEILQIISLFTGAETVGNEERSKS